MVIQQRRASLGRIGFQNWVCHCLPKALLPLNTEEFIPCTLQGRRATFFIFMLLWMGNHGQGPKPEHQYYISPVEHTECKSFATSKTSWILCKEQSNTSRSVLHPCSGSRCSDSGVFWPHLAMKVACSTILWILNCDPFLVEWYVAWFLLWASPSIMSGISWSTSLYTEEIRCTESCRDRMLRVVLR